MAEIRAQCRAAPFEEASSRAQTAPTAHADLRREYQGRVDAFGARLGGLDQSPRTGDQPLRFSFGLLTGIGAADVGGSGAAVGAVVLAWLYSIRAGVIATVLLVPVIVLIVLKDSRIRRLAWTLQERECPDCGYDLAGVPPGIPAETMGEANTGPRACPECGAPWPLVPPRAGMA